MRNGYLSLGIHNLLWQLETIISHLGNLSFPLMLPVAPLVLAVLETGAHYLSMAAAS